MCALIPAAGRGVRFGAPENKVFTPLLGRPLLGWTLEAFAGCDEVDSVILIGGEADLARLRPVGESFGGGKVRDVVPGGPDRQASVCNGLAVCSDAEIVVIHDAARPCVSRQQIESVIQAARSTGAATAAVPVTDTLARATTGGLRGEDVPRDGLWAIQTPQAFARDVLIHAHDKALRNGFRGTDDAGLVTRLPYATAYVEASAENLKVTRPEDLAIAEAILARRQHDTMQNNPPAFRVGHGYDVHPFAEGRLLFLGGVAFPDAPRGLLGHSDADALLHAVCDALLGAAGMDDIGALFPPSDPAHKDRSSLEFLREVGDRLTADGWRVGNIDVTVLAETPKIGPRAGEIKAAIADALHISAGQVGVKATTNEGMGFVGRGEGIAAHATTLIYR